MTSLEPLLTVSQTCEFLGVSKQVLYRMLKRGELHPVTVSQRLRFEPAMLRAYLDRNRA